MNPLECCIAATFIFRRQAPLADQPRNRSPFIKPLSMHAIAVSQHACIFACMRFCMHAKMHACSAHAQIMQNARQVHGKRMHARAHARKKRTHACKNACMQENARMQERMHARMHACKKRAYGCKKRPYACKKRRHACKNACME